jgi:hypothetical protein
MSTDWKGSVFDDRQRQRIFPLASVSTGPPSLHNIYMASVSPGSGQQIITYLRKVVCFQTVTCTRVQTWKRPRHMTNIPALSSERRHATIHTVIIKIDDRNSGHEFQKGVDTKTDWLTDWPTAVKLLGLRRFTSVGHWRHACVVHSQSLAASPFKAQW